MTTPLPTWIGPSLRRGSRAKGWKKNGYLYFLLFVLAGYACLGRGFAYLGVAPVFIGEILLFAGVVTSFGKNARWRRVFKQPTAILLLLFMLWGAIRTVPYFDVYGRDALRDAVLWGYALFALIIAARMIAREEYFAIILDAFYRFSKFYLLLCPFIWVYNVYLMQKMPMFFWGKSARFEEVLVCLSAVAATMFSRVFPYGPFWLVLFCADTLLFLTGNRAGMLAFAAVITMAWLANPFSRRFWLAAGLAGVTILLLAVLDVRINMNRREISLEQLTTNVKSIFGSDSQQLDEQGTKEWRLSWWRQIFDYTVLGEYFWTGKGFGINLSDDDNHKLDYGHGPNQLRSPHNSHLSVLAREGVPGLSLWVILNIAWSVPLFYRLLGARAAGRPRWAAFILLILSLWLAIMVIMSFGVVLEGPSMGILFWCVMGMGIATLHTYGRRPYLLDGPPAHLRGQLPVPPSHFHIRSGRQMARDLR